MEKGKGISFGDKIVIKTAKEEINGILLESHEPGIVLVKLDSGYNIGISRDNILDIRTIKKTEKREKEEKIADEKIKEEFKMSHKKPIIDLIMTGGTISSSLDVKTGAVKWLTSSSEFFRFYPDIFELADIRVINPFMKSSENMDSDDWIKISKIAVKSLKDENVRGVIITHGTDFLHYTGAALSFMIKKLNKPVVLTYSQRSSDRASSDAELNLYCAAKAALSDIAEIMLVGHAGMNDNFCYALQANKCRKMHSSRRDAFKPVNTSPIAKIYRDKIEILKDYKKRKSEKEMKGNKPEVEGIFEDKIALVKFYPGQSPEILNYYFNQGYKGVIIEMSGLGHVITEGKNNWIPVLKEMVKKGMIICASGQTIYGSLDPLVYSPGRELEKAGVIYLKDMLSETAFVKLGWLLGHEEFKKDKNKIKEKMLENISGEFNERLGEEIS